MSSSQLEAIQRDGLAMTVAHAVAIANDAASEHGVAVEQSLVTIHEENTPLHRLWHIHYGPRDYISRRGGDFTVIVDEEAGTVLRVLRGQ